MTILRRTFPIGSEATEPSAIRQNFFASSLFCLGSCSSPGIDCGTC